MSKEKIEKMKGKLVVSCQALPAEPLHSSFIMGRMARAAAEGGALGIRANTPEDIEEIKRNVDLPVIGIWKKDFEDSKVYITPTMEEIDALVRTKTEIIALDATADLRPGGKGIDEFYAECSTVEEALHADALGFDFIGTTLVGYTDQSKGNRIEEDDFKIIREILAEAVHPIVAEGNINTPQKAKRVIELGCYCVVVGSIITRPQVITRGFASVLE